MINYYLAFEKRATKELKKIFFEEQSFMIIFLATAGIQLFAHSIDDKINILQNIALSLIVTYGLFVLVIILAKFIIFWQTRYRIWKFLNEGLSFSKKISFWKYMTLRSDNIMVKNNINKLNMLDDKDDKQLTKELFDLQLPFNFSTLNSDKEIQIIL